MKAQLTLAGLFLAIFLMVAILVEDESYLSGNIAGLEKYRISYKADSIKQDTSDQIVTYYTTLKLKDNASIKMEIPVDWKIYEQDFRFLINDTHSNLESLLGRVDLNGLRISLIDQNEFIAEFKAPSWVKALYVNNSINIPVNVESRVQDVLSSIRHEYVHAYIRVASLGRCPVWLDEGLAQIFEDDQDAIAELRMQIEDHRNEQLSLLNLEGSFTKLSVEKVAIAYAQSYRASLSLMESDQDKIKIYFGLLREGINQREAFKMAFSKSIYNFSKKLRNNSA